MKLKWKKWVMAVMTMCIFGCGSGPGVSSVRPAGIPAVSEVSPQPSSETVTETVADLSSPAPSESPEEEVTENAEGILDLSVLSGTVVYAEVFHMVTEPEDYLGKTVRVKGIYLSTYSEAADKRYFSCLIPDATACCAQGVEFEPKPGYAYPDQFPPEESVITVTGTFDTYLEEGFQYCVLRNADFTIDLRKE